MPSPPSIAVGRIQALVAAQTALQLTLRESPEGAKSGFTSDQALMSITQFAPSP